MPGHPFNMRIDNLDHYPEAVERLADWHFEEWRHLYPDHSREDFAHDLRRCLEQAMIPSTWVLVSEDAGEAGREQTGNGEIWGSASVVEEDMDNNRDLGPWLANVFVHPHYRGRGFGSALVRHVMAQCRAAGMESLYLFTPDQQGLYASLGWQALRVESYHGEQVTIMTARLDQD
ncbi:hypothetical protein Maes01_00456 [Microbulbifer aestuariivivens]|uniref:N-acetyltransferase domain-containing protein n=1 Tax=Microbulbifer aestuariivivens TaxID=1908308 RepID=A0ABP9WL29_9GAMM